MPRAPGSRQIWSAEDEAKLMAFRSQGATFAMIAKELGRTQAESRCTIINKRGKPT